jgi:hypothetical protein
MRERPCVESEHTFDKTGELGGNPDRLGPSAIPAGRMLESLCVRLERGTHRTKRSAKTNFSALGADAGDRKSLVGRERFHLFHVLGAGAVLAG